MTNKQKKHSEFFGTAVKSRTGRVANLIRQHAADTRGNVSIFTVLAMLPVILAAGAAIDYTRINRERSMFQASIDSAAMAIVSSDKASLTGLTDSQKQTRIAQLKSLAQSYIDKNYAANFIGDNDISIDLQVFDDKIILTGTHTYPTTLMKLAGIDSTQLTVESEVKKAARPVEIVMVMDTTGSMGTTYMAQAKTAAHNLMDKIYNGNKTNKPESQYIRAALVPFSGAVRLNKNAYDFNLNWIDTTGANPVSKLNFSDSTWHNYMAWSKMTGQSWNGCVEARMRGSSPADYNVNDTAPDSSTPATLFPAYFAPDEASFSFSSGKTTYSSTSSPYNFINSYIGTSGTPNETTGSVSIATTTDLTDANFLLRQNNVNKYVNRSITAESSSSYGPWFNCATSPIVPLTYNRSKIENGIDAMSASGSTVIPEGLAWGWRVLSPTEPFTKVEAGPTLPADTISTYNHPRWRKILVLMTDGENDVLSSGNQVNTLNGGWYSAYGRGKAASSNRFGTTTTTSLNPALDTAMLSLCSKIKASGIEIYTVAFRVTNTTIQNNLKTCATDTAHYSYAADGVALGAVFSSIGQNVVNTSIYYSK